MKEFNLEGYDFNLIVDDEGNIWVTSRELERRFGWLEDTARRRLKSKSLKAFAGKDLTVDANKTATVVDESGKLNRQKLYSFEILGAIVAYEAVMEKNPNAIVMLTTGLLDSARSLVLEKAGFRADAQNREAWISARIKGKVARRSLTDRLKAIGCGEALDSIKGGYGRVTRNVYSLAGISYTGEANFRDTLNDDQLRRLEHVEETLARLISNGKTYEEAYRIYKDLMI